MKRIRVAWLAAFAAAVVCSGAPARSAAQAQPKQQFIYPQKGQSPDQQAKDQAECQSWAKQQSGVDPNAPPPQGGHTGGTLGGAAKGAAVGAAVGAIAGDAGRGAGAGAVVGGVGGRRGSKKAAQAEQATTTDTFQRAFAACMEGRGYTVK